MTGDLMGDPETNTEAATARVSWWRRGAEIVVANWPVPWPMANGILLILLVGLLVPLVPDAISTLTQAIGVGWVWLGTASDGMDITNGERIRNLALSFAGPLGVIAIWLAWRRTNDGREQTKTQAEQLRVQGAQVRIQMRQLDSVESRQYEDRYQRAIDLLGSTQENSQLAGITQLDRIRYDRPAEYDEMVLDLFCDLVSEKLRFTESVDTLELYKADYDSGFNPRVNARIGNLLLGDSLVRQPGQYVSLRISRTRLGHLGDIGQGRPKDETEWRINFDQCHIESVDLLPRNAQSINFFMCQIDKIELYCEEPDDVMPIVFRHCVFADMRIFDGLNRKLSARNFKNQYGFFNCKLDNGGDVTGHSILDFASREGDDARLWGYRDDRNPDVD